MRGKFKELSVLVRWKIREICLGFPFLAILCIQQLIFFLIQRSTLTALERDGLLVASHPSRYGLFISVLLLGGFLFLYTAAEPSRDGESGNLETLFYGPVSEKIYLSACFIAFLTAVFVSFLNLLGALLAGSFFIGYEVPASLLPLLPSTILCFCCMGLAGLFFSVLCRQTRLALILASIILLFSLAVSAGNFWFSLNDASGSFELIFFRKALSMVNRFLSMIFPLGFYLDDISRFIAYGNIPLWHIIFYLVYGFVAFPATIGIMHRRGVIRR
jgi:ABC-type transport system involved in multi-copper enzyme maturation permease subunit